MQAIGLLETQGYVPAIEGLDTMAKTSHIRLVELNVVKGGIITVIIEGEVSAVTAAVSAGVASVHKLGSQFYRTSHVIPRPDDELSKILPPSHLEEVWEKPEKREENTKDIEKEDLDPFEDYQDEKEELEDVDVDFTPENITAYVNAYGLEKSLEELRRLRVVSLRDWARKIPDFPIQGREVSKARKDELMNAFISYISTQNDQ